LAGRAHLAWANIGAPNKKSPTTGAAGQDFHHRYVAGASLCAGARFLQADDGGPRPCRRSFSPIRNSTPSTALPGRWRPRRPAFLELVAQSLAGAGEIGDGTVARVCAEVQRRFWNPSHLGQASGKYA
jgi:hypothetical protein